MQYSRWLIAIFAGLALGVIIANAAGSAANALYPVLAGGTALFGLLSAIAARHKAGQSPLMNLLTAIAAGLALVQAALAWVMPTPGLWLEIARILLGMTTFGAALSLLVAARLPREQLGHAGLRHPAHKTYFRSVALTGIGFLLLFITGSLVSQTGSGAACPDWPLCWGEIFPAHFTLEVAILLLHRFTVVIIGLLVAAVILQTRRGYKKHHLLQQWSSGLGLLFLGQMAMGGLYAVDAIPVDALRLVHLALTAITWGSMVVLGSIIYLTVETVVPLADEPALERPPLTVKQRALTYFKLTKPWVMILLLLTTLTAMVIAAQGIPAIPLMLYTLLGGILSAGGASVLNSYIDSDIDQQMSRTSRRATVTGLVTPQETLVLGLTLSALSFLLFALFVNMLSAILSTIGIVYYVFFYTLYLKRTTIHNIIIGGAAGAIPPLVGWTAVTNSLDLGAFYLFAIIFFWTPPHTWALAMLVKKDYAQARVPMLPVVVGEKETSYQIWLYSVLLIPLTLLPFTFSMVSWFYLIAAALLGARFLQLAWKLWHNSSNKALSKKLYKYSQSYLALLFMVMALDRMLF